jgi:hypothetical protein
MWCCEGSPPILKVATPISPAWCLKEAKLHIIQHEQAELARESYADHPRSFDDVIVRPSWKPY